MMKKWLKPIKVSSLQKQLEEEAQKKNEALCVEEFNKRSARNNIRLRELNEVRNQIIKQCVQETRGWFMFTEDSSFQFPCPFDFCTIK